MISRAIIVSLIFSAVIYAVPIKQTAQTISDADIQNIVDKMISYDQDYAHANVDFTINYGNKTTYDSDQDVSPNPLFSYVNESIFNRPTYQVFFALRNEFNPDIRVAEVNTTQKTENIANFMQTIMQTDVFNAMWQFLLSYNVTGISSDYNTMKAYMQNLWFGEYPRSSSYPVLSSSGWEHVFLGEWKTDNTVDGLHNWVQFHELEKTKDINYYGYMEYEGDVLPTIQYAWESYIKPEGSFIEGASVEFNFALLSLCYLTKPGDYGCQFTLNNYKVAVTSYEEDYNGGKYISTAYPEDNTD